MNVGQRYETLFGRMKAADETAFIPFCVLGDPDVEASREVLFRLVESGADALELGIAFSDPIADGPTIQAADLRALHSGVRLPDAMQLIAAVRERHREIPIGLLVYANLLEANGVESFYQRAALAGVDSVLVADVPTLEAAPYVERALHAQVCPVLIATANARQQQLEQIAQWCRGYTYVVTRSGVTGAEVPAGLDHRELLGRLRELRAPPCVLGFGISRPEHVRAARDVGAAGVISGSAVVQHIADGLEDRLAMLSRLEGFVREMKAASRAA